MQTRGTYFIFTFERKIFFLTISQYLFSSALQQVSNKITRLEDTEVEIVYEQGCVKTKENLLS